MKQPYKYLLFFAICILAGAARLISPALRPMHTDESVNALKTGMLLDSGYYRYDPGEYHGPVLYYAAFLAAKIRGQDSYMSLDEQTLRMVPAVFGLSLLLLLLLLTGELGWPVVLAAALLLAVSPALAFYSRYYIHETLLVFFSYAAIISALRFIWDRKVYWLVLTGIFTGLMHATKETCLISYGAVILTLLLFIVTRSGQPGRMKMSLLSMQWWHLLIIIVAGAVVSALFCSSFFSHPQGIIDSYTAYRVYTSRAGFNNAHVHPWYYYIRIFLLPDRTNSHCWSDAWLLIPAFYGLFRLFSAKQRNRKNDLLLFIGCYTMLLLIFYSAIPYKTPWNMLQVYPGIILLTAYGLTEIINIRTAGWLKTSILILILAAAVHWVWTSWQLNFIHYNDRSNPWVYAHTSPDVLDLRDEIDRIGTVHPDKYEMPVEIIFPQNDYWPLPWYLRRYPNSGYWDHVDTCQAPATLIIAAASFEQDLVKKLYDLPPPGKRYLYVPLFRSYKELRPGIEMRAWLRKDIWDKYQVAKVHD